MSEIRENRITGEWVIIAPERAKRGGTPMPAAEQREIPSFLEGCPFCPGNEAATAAERFRLEAGDGSWLLRSVVNKFSVLSPAGDVTLPSCATSSEASVNGIGLHEVLIESPRHDVSMAMLPAAHVHRILEAYRHRFIEFYRDARVRHVIVFKNHGADAGASQQHLHSQIVGLPIVPGQVTDRIERARRFFADSGRCLACTQIAQELGQACRIIAGNAEFVAFIPYAALSPYHLWIFPKRHAACFSEQPVKTLSALAEILRAPGRGSWDAWQPCFQLRHSLARSAGKGCAAFSLVYFDCAADKQEGRFRAGDRDIHQSVVAGIMCTGAARICRLDFGRACVSSNDDTFRLLPSLARMRFERRTAGQCGILSAIPGKDVLNRP